LQLANGQDVYAKSQADAVRKTFPYFQLQIGKSELSYMPASYEFDKNFND